MKLPKKDPNMSSKGLQFAVAAAVLVTSLTPAYALTQHGVLAGMSVKSYGTSGSGAGADVIYVDNGNGYINGVLFSWSAPGSLTVPGSLKGGLGAGAGGLTPRVPYYLYAICANSLPMHILISVVAPNPDGTPSAAINDMNACGTGIPAVNDQLGLFLGSILTDANGDVIPFARNGDEVVLMPSTSIGLEGMDQESWAPPAGGAACTAQTLTFGAAAPAGHVTAFPETASGMLVDVYTANAQFAILQPFLAASCGGGKWNAQWESNGYTVLAPTSHERIAVKTSENCPTGAQSCSAGISLAQEAAVPANASVQVTYVGYIEKIKTLSFF